MSDPVQDTSVNFAGDNGYLASTEKFEDAKPDHEITDSEVQFLSSLKPTVPLQRLRAHALENYAKGMASGGVKYRCFKEAFHLLPAITDHPLYSTLLAQPAKGLFIDLGGGSGTDARKLIQDGWPAEQIVVSDVEPFLWNVGLHLFQDGPHGPVTFGEANILKSTDMQPGGALHVYLNQAEVLYAQAVLHLFPAETVITFARTAKDLLKPGGLFIGANSSSDPPGIFGSLVSGDQSRAPWLYSPTTFKAALEQAGYVNVRVELSDFQDFVRRRGFGKQIYDKDITYPFGDGRRLYWLSWSATKPAEDVSKS